MRRGKKWELVKNPSGQYSVRIRTPHGERSFPISGATTYQEALKIARKAAVEELAVAASVTKLTSEVVTTLLVGRTVKVSEVINEWTRTMSASGTKDRTVQNCRQILTQFAKNSGLLDKQPSTIDATHIDGFINGDDGTKLSTRKLKLTILRGFCDFCGHRAYIVGNPARVVRNVNVSKLPMALKERTKRSPMSDSEVERLVSYLESKIHSLLRKIDAVLPEHRQRSKVVAEYRSRISSYGFWIFAIIMSRYTGLRLSDVCSLEWDSIKDPNTVIVWTRKRDKRVVIPAHPQVKHVISIIPPIDERFCFPEYAQLNNSHMRSQISVQFNRICKRAGVKERCFHDLRRAFASGIVDQMVAAGWTVDESIKTAKELLAHSDIATTEWYVTMNKKPAILVGELKPMDQLDQPEES